MWYISNFGTSLFIIILAITAFLAGKSSLSLQLLAGLIICFMVIFPIKMLFYKDRPERRMHKNWIEKFDAAAFPSAHSNRAALLFIILSFFFAKIQLAVFFLVMSLLIGYSRIYVKRHYWADVVVGYFIGIVEGFLIVIFL